VLRDWRRNKRSNGFWSIYDPQREKQKGVFVKDSPDPRQKDIIAQTGAEIFTRLDGAVGGSMRHIQAKSIPVPLSEKTARFGREQQIRGRRKTAWTSNLTIKVRTATWALGVQPQRKHEIRSKRKRWTLRIPGVIPRSVLEGRSPNINTKYLHLGEGRSAKKKSSELPSEVWSISSCNHLGRCSYWWG